jgi:peptide/nickel transport system substrate-binding protein
MSQVWAYNRKIKPFLYDIEKSKQMLAEEGWKDTDGDGYLDKNGKKFSFAVITAVNNPTRVAVATYMQEQYKQIGVEVIVKAMEWNAFIEESYKKKFDARIAAWQTDFTFPPSMKSLWHSETVGKENSFNIISYQNKEVDMLIDKGARMLDQNEAKIVWDRMQEILYEDQPYTFLFTRKMIYGANKRVRGVENIDVRGTYKTLEDWWIPMQERKEKI